MIVIICVDKNMGISFNERRVSRDKLLISWIINLVGNNKLWMKEYSRGLFPEDCNVFVSDNYLNEAKNGDFCFVEEAGVEQFYNKIESVIICNWNQDYPSDVKFQSNLYNAWSHYVLTEIIGNSHEKITIEKWVKKLGD